MTYDVIVVGYGPTGMLAAALLGRAGHRVAVVERYRTLYNLPRVGIVHDDVLRMFQEVGIVDAILPATEFLPTYELANHGRILLSNRVQPMATHGWPEFTSIYQPAFEGELDRLAKSIPTIDVLQGRTAIELAQDDDHVEIAVQSESGGRERLRARYLIGADGGNSFVRRALGITYEDLGFDQDWLVVDLRVKRRRPEWPALRQFCEPEQPGMTMTMGPEHRRYSFMIFPDESREEALKPANIWRRLARPEGGSPDDFEIIRAVTYQFRSLVAPRWRAGRVFLAGDSAHQMPPFLAQGLCSGFRDAHNLAWKMDLVLQGKASPRLLDAYELERAPGARATVIESARVGGNVIERDPEKIRLRDAQLAALAESNRLGKQLIAFRVPGVDQGFIGRDRDGARAPAAGDAFGQARVRREGVEGRFDDVVGHGFMIVARNGDPRAALGDDDLAFWKGLGGRIVRIDGTGPDAVEDVEGRYGELMDDYRCDAIVKRPDYAIFAACAELSGLPRVMADLRGQLARR